ncbi:MAG: hypothetical protein HY240_10160 [Actinobacteria bacterium]|nr:hypothetical protein [Actinomycetota bacterium]
MAEQTEPFRLLSPDGAPVGDTDVGLEAEDLRALLRWMILARRLDRECIALQRQGELTVYPGFEGQEAAQVGSAFALGPEDFVFPSFRELAAALVRGVDAVQYLWYHRGTWHGGPYDPRATRFGPICVPVATQIAHGVGYAMGLKLDGAPACSLTYFGDGSASEGDFHEAANLAAVFAATAILFCQNNGWAISALHGRRSEPVPQRRRGAALAGARPDRALPHLAGGTGARQRRVRCGVRAGGRNAGGRGPRRDHIYAGAAGRVDFRLGLRRPAGVPRAGAGGGARRRWLSRSRWWPR